METKDPALTKTPAIAGDETAGNITTDPVASNEQSAALAATHNDSFHDSDDEIEENTTVNKGTDTFQESIVGSEHVNEGDNEARQPDRRDQKVIRSMKALTKIRLVAKHQKRRYY